MYFYPTLFIITIKLIFVVLLLFTFPVEKLADINSQKSQRENICFLYQVKLTFFLSVYLRGQMCIGTLRLQKWLL